MKKDLTLDEAFDMVFSVETEEIKPAKEVYLNTVIKYDEKLKEEWSIGDLCFVSCVDLNNNRWTETALMFEPKLCAGERQIFIGGKLVWYPATQIHKTKEEAQEWNSQ